MDNKQFLHNKYITDPSEQRVIYNDGAYISFFTISGDIVTMHQSDEINDNFICITLDDLKKIINN